MSRNLKSIASAQMSPQYASIASGSVSATKLADAHTLITTNNTRRLLVVNNGLDKAVILTIGGYNAFLVPASAAWVLPIMSCDLQIDSSQVIGVYRSSEGAPTSGNLYVQVA